MAHWEYKLRLKDIWHDEDMPFEAKRDEIVRRIKSSEFYKEEWTTSLEDSIGMMVDSCDIPDFDRAFNEFYNYADLFRVWVETF